MRGGEEIKEILLELGPFKPFGILYHYEPLDCLTFVSASVHMSINGE